MKFRKERSKLQKKLSRLIMAAKEYIVANCHRVDDWSEMSLFIKNGNNVDNANKLEEAFYVSKSSIEQRVKRKAARDAQVKAGYIDFYADDTEGELGPIVSVTEPILDESDGDFSITIDGLEWWWIDNDSVIQISDFIENALDRKRKINKLLDF